jgi:hypothetical protein
MTRRVLIAALSVAAAMALTLAGCSAARTEVDKGTVAPPASDAAGGPAGMRLASGYYQQEDGTVLALGTLEWRDIEGGFWCIVGGTEATGDLGKTLAVIPDVAKADAAYAALAGKTVQVTAKPIEGASIRNAGPEIAVIKIEEVTDAGGATQ